MNQIKEKQERNKQVAIIVGGFLIVAVILEVLMRWT